MPPADLLGTATDRGLRPDHARDLCEIVIEDLQDRAGNLDRTALQLALARHGYLAVPLSKLYPDQTEHQREQLGRLLQLAHGGVLNRRAAQEILDSQGHQPTAALFAVVFGMVEPAEAATAERAFSRGFLGNANFSRHTREQALRQLPAANGSATRTLAQPTPPQDAVGRLRLYRHRFAGLQRGWRFTPLFWLITGIVIGAVLLKLGQVVTGTSAADSAPEPSTSATVSAPVAIASTSPSGSQDANQPDPCGMVTAATLQTYLPGASELPAASPALARLSDTQTGNCSWTTLSPDGATLSMGYRVFGPGTAEYEYQSDVQSDVQGSPAERVSDIGAQATAIFKTQIAPALSGSENREVVELLTWAGNAEIKVQIAYENKPLLPSRPLAAVTAVARDVLAALSRS